MIDDCETFEDVLIAAEALYKYCKKQHEIKRKKTNQTEVPVQSLMGIVDEDAKKKLSR